MTEQSVDRLREILGAPDDVLIPLWRYMDFTKYVSMIESQALFFARADKLNDPFEGSMSKGNVKFRPEVYKDAGIPDEVFNQNSKLLRTVREWVYLNCWHANNCESAAMWKLYAHSHEAIAVRTTWGRLLKALPKHVHLGVVRYIDYENDWIPESNLLYPYLHKRQSFEHEREVRALIMAFPTKVGEPIEDLGRLVTIDIASVIEQVVIAPTAPEWFHSIVHAVTEKYGMGWQVIRSSLDTDPIY